MFSDEERPSLFRREEAAHDAHAEHDQGEQHQNFRRIVGEEADRLAEVALRVDWRQRDNPFGKWDKLAVDEAPQNQGGNRPPDPLRVRRAGTRRMFGDGAEAHAACLS